MQQPPNYPNYGDWQQPQQPNAQYPSSPGNQPPFQPQWPPNTYYQPQQPSSGQWQQPQYPGPPETYYSPQQQPFQQAPVQYQQQWQQPPMLMPQMPQQPPKKSKLPLVLGIVAGLLILGCVGTFAIISIAANHAASTLNTAATTITSQLTSIPTSGSSSQVVKIGQAITLNGVSCTLVSVKTLSPDPVNSLQPGNEYIVVHVKLNNTSQSEQDYDPFEFHVRSGNGNITNEEIITPRSYTANNELNSGKLSAGGTVEGDIIFQAPKGDHKAELTWQPSFFGNAGDNGWYLGL